MDDHGTHDEELEALEERLRKIQQPLENAEPAKSLDFDEHFDSRLGKLESKAQSVKGVRDSQKAEVARVQKQDNDSGRGLGIGLTVAYMIVGVPLVGAGIGWLIDKQVGGSFWKGIGTLCGFILGLILVVMTVNKANANSGR